MADWRVYAKAAQNTARRQAPGAARAVRDGARDSAAKASVYARAAARAADQGTRADREQLRRRSVATAKVARERARRANIVPRFLRAVRDALIMGVALFVIWFVVTRTGVQIPFTIVLVAVGVLMVARFAFALVEQFMSGRPDDDDGGADDEYHEDDEYGGDDEFAADRDRAAHRDADPSDPGSGFADRDLDRR